LKREKKLESERRGLTPIYGQRFISALSTLRSKGSEGKRITGKGGKGKRGARGGGWGGKRKGGGNKRKEGRRRHDYFGTNLIDDKPIQEIFARRRAKKGTTRRKRASWSGRGRTGDLPCIPETDRKEDKGFGIS